MGKGAQLGLIEKRHYQVLEDKMSRITKSIEHLKAATVKPSDEVNQSLASVGSPPLSQATTLYGLLKRNEISYDDLRQFPGWEPQDDPFVKKQIEIETKYEGYIRRQFEATRKLKEMERKKVPTDFDYSSVPGLSSELRAKLSRVAPATIGQMERIPGITQSAISSVLIMLKKQEATGATE